ncbi:hypothetical protein FFLO_03735 [Filobasidium floriforme]|uniref:Uncharacterized protein n=1 Tax=Filobasidium floriforme TaxID=5210 RepID=A0A8K0JK51_9TREE|nr:hypothetical protein FFLO_03735 [Filobasidium floriforme]
MTEGVDRNPPPDEQQILNFEQLTKSIFPEELEDAHVRLGSVQEDPESAIKTSSPERDHERDGASKPDLEHEIIALAHQIIRQHNLVLPSGQTTCESVSPSDMPARYPPIPLDKRGEHAMIWRTTELSAETFNPLDRKAKKAAIHTPTTYDNDLEPVLPPNLTRDVVEWTNRLLFNMLATRPDLVKDSTPNAPSSEAQKAGTTEQAALTETWEWTDVLAALMVDEETSAERELNSRIVARLRATFDSNDGGTQSRTGSAPPGQQHNERIAILQSRQNVLEDSLKRRQILEAAFEEEEARYSMPSKGNKKRQRTSGL